MEIGFIIEVTAVGVDFIRK